MDEQIESLNTATTAIALYLYRHAGYPYGETLSGLMTWIDIQRKVFTDFSESKKDV